MLIQEFELYLKKKNLTDNTCRAYQTALQNYEKSYDTISVENLQSYRQDILSLYLPSTVNQRIHAVNHYLQFLEDQYPDAYPTLYGFRLKSVKKPHSSFQDSIISNDDCVLLQNHLKKDEQYFWYFIVRFLVTTGVRGSELTQIKIEDLTCGYLDLYSKGGKMRRIYMTDSLCEEALKWCHLNGRFSGFIFARKNGVTVTARGIHSRIKHFANLYGIDPETVYPHSFRHRFAKNFLARCGDIALLADLLGHESIETTRIYLTSSSKEQQTLLDEIVTW